MASNFTGPRCFCVFFPGEISGPKAAALEGSAFLNCVDWNFLISGDGFLATISRN